MTPVIDKTMVQQKVANAVNDIAKLKARQNREVKGHDVRIARDIKCNKLTVIHEERELRVN